MRWTTRLSVVGVLVASLALQPVQAQSTATGLDHNKLPPALRAHISGALELSSKIDKTSARPTNFFPKSDDCGVASGGNTKVNQDCLNVTDPDLQGRGQAQSEPSVSVDPNDSRYIVASYNDSRRGDGTCGTSYSLDGGKTSNGSTAPTGFTPGTGQRILHDDFGAAREYWQSGGDSSVAWDSRGNAYLSCLLFNRGNGVSPNPDLSSGFVVFRSTQNKGAFWDFPGRYVIADNDTTGVGDVLEDKPYLTVDADQPRYGERALPHPRRSRWVRQQLIRAAIHRGRRHALHSLGQLQHRGHSRRRR